MQFLSAASAWFAAALPAIILMYLLKRKYERTEIASHLLWKRVLKEQEANAPWQKLQSRWLLLLQLIIAVLIVLALMEPYWEQPSRSTHHAVLLIDRSGSMTKKASAEPGDGTNGRTTILNKAIVEAKRWLNEQPEKLPVSIVVTGKQPKLIAAGLRDRNKAQELLSSITPYYGTTDYTAALSLADSLHAGQPGGLTVLFSDGQWGSIEELSSIQLRAPLRFMDVNESLTGDNVALVSFDIAGKSGEVPGYYGMAAIRNNGIESVTSVVALYAHYADRPPEMVGELMLHAAPDSWQSAEIRHLPPADYYRAQLQSDAVTIDNVLYQFPGDTAAGKVLLVTEVNLFLEKALQLSGLTVMKATPDGAAPSGETAASADWAVLDTNADALLEEAEWSALLAQLPLWMIDHPEAPQGLIRPSSSHTVIGEHPVTEHLQLADMHIGALGSYEQREMAWGEAIITYGGIPALYAGTVDGLPRLWQSFRLQDTDWPLRQEFPVFVLQAASWMNGGLHPHLGTVVAGDTMEFAMSGGTLQAKWELVASADEYARQELEAIRGEAAYLPLDRSTHIAPQLPGLYRLTELGEQGRVLAQRYLHVKADDKELMERTNRADWTFLEETSGSSGTEQADFSRKGDPIRTQEDGMLPNSYIYAWIALLLILLLAAEWEVYRRGY
ncbi:BatA and WFA domain-containing protein [Paenibacillus sp. J5C_2022]|uniref:vWA domain-containing protein n=1 Tax=Paenibacillus sp. J5C2022 TaxID=2977129 RepID=UPI0021CEF2BE|nr:BatA and WFA domain-containing protein [Paenibacillus sp. J5C2022]MCU6707205.1 BatA and WFA domain-containing protein [Paenibacillus sp. J5C2022]